MDTLQRASLEILLQGKDEMILLKKEIENTNTTNSRTYRTHEDYVGIPGPSGSPWPRIVGAGGTNSEQYPYWNPYINIKQINSNPEIIDDALVELLWERMYKKKVIEFCKWCGAANAFDNPTCVQCGGPPG